MKQYAAIIIIVGITIFLTGCIQPQTGAGGNTTNISSIKDDLFFTLGNTNLTFTQLGLNLDYAYLIANGTNGFCQYVLNDEYIQNSCVSNGFANSVYVDANKSGFQNLGGAGNTSIYADNNGYIYKGTIHDNTKANITYMIVEEFLIGGDGQKNYTMLNSFYANSTHIYINGLKKRLFYDYNETLSYTTINITTTLNQSDLLEVEYEKV